MKKILKSQWKAFILLSIGLLFVLYALNINHHYDKFDITEDALRFNELSIKTDGNFYYNEELHTLTVNPFENSSATITLPDGNYMQGEYYISLQYHIKDADVHMIISSKNILHSDNTLGQVFLDIPLDSSENSMTASFNIPEDLRDIEFSFIVNGDEFVFTKATVYGNNISTNDSFILQIIACLIYLVFIFVIFYPKDFAKPVIIKNQYISGKRVWFAITFTFIAIVVLTSLPFFNKGIWIGFDVPYHFARIEGQASALISGQFPVRIHGLLLNGYGYPNGIFYPELFMYIPAIMRVLGMSVLTIYITYVIFVQFFTLVIGYIYFSKSFNSRVVGMVTSIIYYTSAYRLCTVYGVGALGEYTAMMFLPMVFYSLYSVIWKSKNSWPLLCISMTALLQSHILSFAQTIIVFVFVCIIGIKQILGKEKRILPLLKATILTILLNFGFLVPLLWTSNKYVFDVFTRPWMLVNSSSITDFIGFFIADSLNTHLSLPFIICIFMFLIYLILFSKKEKKLVKVGIYSLLIGSIFLLSNTRFFPWSTIKNIPLLSDFLRSFHFTARFLVSATFCLSICCGVSFMLWVSNTSHKKLIATIICGFCVLSAMFAIGDVGTYLKEYIPSKHQVPIGTSTLGDVGQHEYIIKDTSLSSILYAGASIVSEKDNITFSNVSRDGTNISFDYDISSNEIPQKILLPLSYYPSYVAEINGVKYDTSMDGNHQVQVTLNEPTGHVEVSYKSITSFRLAELVSLSTLIAIIVYIIAIKYLNLNKYFKRSN